MTNATNPLMFILKADPEKYLDRPSATILVLIKAAEAPVAFLLILRTIEFLYAMIKKGALPDIPFLPPNILPEGAPGKVISAAGALCLLAALVCICIEAWAALRLRFSLEDAAIMKKTRRGILAVAIILFLLFLCLCGGVFSGYVRDGMQFVRQVKETTGITGVRDLPNAAEKLQQLELSDLTELIEGAGLTELTEMLSASDLEEFTEKLSQLDAEKLAEIISSAVQAGNLELIGAVGQSTIKGTGGLVFLIASAILCAALLLLRISYHRGALEVLTAIEYEIRLGFKETGLGKIRLARDSFLFGLLFSLTALFSLAGMAAGPQSGSVLRTIGMTALAIKYFAVFRCWKHFKKCHR